MPDPVISVVIQISEPLTIGSLGDVIASASEQSFGTPEIVIVTTPAMFDGEVKDEIFHRRDSVRHYIADADLRGGGLLRIGAAAARGRFITWLRADDSYDPRKIEFQMNALGTSGSGCVTCGAMSSGQSIPTAPLEPNGGAVGVIKSLLDGSRYPASLLVSRDLLEAIGGFDPTFVGLFELDLAVRLALRYPFAHVPDALVRRNFKRMTRLEDRQEFRRIANYVIEDARESGLAGDLHTLGQIVSALGEDVETFLPAVRQHVASLVKKQDLVIGIVPDDYGSDPRKVAETLGAPDTHTLQLPSTGNNVQALAAAMAGSTAERIIIIDPAALPEPDAFTMQLLHSSAEQLDACLPCRDPLIYTPTPAPSLIPGTLFKLAALERTDVSIERTEAQFWAAFSRTGRIGALPAAAPKLGSIPQPARMWPTALVTALIDRDWYIATNADLASTADPADHFRNIGWREGRRPNPWFHTAWYLAKNPEVLERNINPLEHFVVEGARAGLQPSPAFDIEWYSRQYLDADVPCAEALLHFMTVGLATGAVPYPRLYAPRAEQDESWKASGRTHSVADNGALLEALIDADWYRANYAPGRSASFNAAAHYLEQGWREGFDPNPWFDTRWYLSQNEDARNTDPLTHFIEGGANRGRKPHSFFDIRWYAQHYLGGAEPTAEVLLHFLTIGLAAGAVPHPRLAAPAVSRRLLQTPVPERSPLIKRLQNILALSSANGGIVAPLEVDLWPLLLAEDFPPDVSAVLLLCEPTEEAFRLAKAAASVLPIQESPIFGIVESEHTLRITNRLEREGISVKLRTPEQNLLLRDLLNGLNCQRAAIAGPDLLGGSVAQMIRDVGVPVFTRRSNSRTQGTRPDEAASPLTEGPNSSPMTNYRQSDDAEITRYKERVAMLEEQLMREREYLETMRGVHAYLVQDLQRLREAANDSSGSAPSVDLDALTARLRTELGLGDVSGRMSKAEVWRLAQQQAELRVEIGRLQRRNIGIERTLHSLAIRIDEVMQSRIWRTLVSLSGVLLRATMRSSGPQKSATHWPSQQ